MEAGTPEFMSRLGKIFCGGAVALAGLVSPSSSAHAAVATVGAPAPAWQLTDMHGQIVRSSDFRDKVVLLNFFRTTCVPCGWEIPDLAALQDQYGPQGLVIIGIAAQQSVETLEPYLEERQVNYTVCPSVDSILWDYAVFPSGAIPVTVVMDRNGVVASWYRYYQTKAYHESVIQPLLAARAGPPISVQRVAEKMYVSWPSNNVGFILESKTQYATQTNWQAVTNEMVLSNGMYRVSLRTQESSRFFRLRKP
jgi:peroxiredoxin